MRTAGMRTMCAVLEKVRVGPSARSSHHAAVGSGEVTSIIFLGMTLRWNTRLPPVSTLFSRKGNRGLQIYSSVPPPRKSAL